MKIIMIIPARMESKRLPGKPLKTIGGKSIIRSCYLSAMAVSADKIYVSSGDSDILAEIIGMRKLMGGVIATSDKPINGTERVAEAARILQLKSDDIVVNLQGDMPFVDPEIINKPVKLMKSIPDCNVTSVMTLLPKEDYGNQNKVKVIIDEAEKAVSFSREYKENSNLHIGVYVFRNSFLQEYDTYGMVAKERQDHLEQQRIMHMGEPIYMSYVDNMPTVIDTKEDLKEARCQFGK